MSRARQECAQMISLLRLTATHHDRHPERRDVNGLVHACQMADRVRLAGYSDAWIAVALVHDAAKPLTEAWHGTAVTEMVREYVSDTLPLALFYLPRHRVTGSGALDVLDALSFDVRYPTPTLDEMVPYVERLYGVA